LVEDALKKGRATFTWKQVRSWTNSTAATATSQHNDEMVELPLKVIAPLFLAQQRTAKSAPKIAVDKSIPDLFARAAGTASVTPTAPATNGSSDTAQFRAPKPSPISHDTKFVSKPPVSNSPATDDVRSGTEFLKRYATPNDIVAKAASLDGVLGALITLPDGLLVASHLPANMNGDALAAFTPQIYVRVTQSAREYRMGDLKELTFTVGNTQWKIYKVGSIFFAAFGKSDEQLPVKELTSLAAELDRKPKSQV
jgi:predicted regulator of Ras-like GTPase activity (Roadblock/LC7/MglB family)